MRHVRQFGNVVILVEGFHANRVGGIFRQPGEHELLWRPFPGRDGRVLRQRALRPGALIQRAVVALPIADFITGGRIPILIVARREPGQGHGVVRDVGRAQRGNRRRRRKIGGERINQIGERRTIPARVRSDHGKMVQRARFQTRDRRGFGRPGLGRPRYRLNLRRGVPIFRRERLQRIPEIIRLRLPGIAIIAGRRPFQHNGIPFDFHDLQIRDGVRRRGVFRFGPHEIRDFREVAGFIHASHGNIQRGFVFEAGNGKRFFRAGRRWLQRRRRDFRSLFPLLLQEFQRGGHPNLIGARRRGGRLFPGGRNLGLAGRLFGGGRPGDFRPIRTGLFHQQIHNRRRRRRIYFRDIQHVRQSRHIARRINRFDGQIIRRIGRHAFRHECFRRARRRRFRRFRHFLRGLPIRFGNFR